MTTKPPPSMINTLTGTVGSGLVTDITLGQIGSYATCTYRGDIVSYIFNVDAGTATIRVSKIATGTTAPTSANNINTSGVSISTGTQLRSTTLSDFTTTTVSAYDSFAFYLTAVSGVSRLSFQLEIEKK